MKILFKNKNNIFFLFFLFTLSFCNSTKNSIKSHLAGSWYPETQSKFIDFIEQLDFQELEEQKNEHIRAIIVPHAGYAYSGKIAAAAYRLAQSDIIDRIIILAPSHYKFLKGIAYLSFSHYKLPFGTLTIDNDKNIKNVFKLNPLFIEDNEIFEKEHAVEVQLPLIHYFFPHASLIPLIVGDLGSKERENSAEILRQIITPTTLVVISSDLTHYGADFNYIPFKENILSSIKNLDANMIKLIENNDLKGFMNSIKKTKATVCGKIPIEILLEIIKNGTFGSTTTQLVSYGTSSDISGDTDHVVSYASLIVKQEPKPVIKNVAPADFTANAIKDNTIILSEEEKQSLLSYARATLENSFIHNPSDKKIVDLKITPPLQKKSAVFVTLYTKKSNKKELRGCIGQTEAKQPLYEAIRDMTLSAAFRDPRFKGLIQEELDTITIEISILGEPYPVTSYKDIILNKHGIILSVENHSALFLPKVPHEFGWDLKKTLEYLSEKAGLNKNAWKLPSAQFQVFEAFDFGE